MNDIKELIIIIICLIILVVILNWKNQRTYEGIVFGFSFAVFLNILHKNIKKLLQRIDNIKKL